MTQATLSAGQPGIESARHRTSGGCQRSQTVHPGYDLNAVWAGLLPEQILETRHSEVIETATSTCCVFRRQPRQQTKLGSNQFGDCTDRASQTRPSHPWDIPAPPLKRSTAMTWTSQCPARAVSVGRSSKRSFHDSPGLVSRA